MVEDVMDKIRKPLVLLVDDMPDNLQLLAQILSDDYDLAFATDGQQAIALTLESQPDLILLDVMMPGMDGYETCCRLKKNTAVRAIPVIFLTARTEPDDVVKGFDVGGADYIVKPFRAMELRARVRTHIELGRLRSFLSICSICNKIRNEEDRWERLDQYIARKTRTVFSHGYCPECHDKMLSELEGDLSQHGLESEPR